MSAKLPKIEFVQMPDGSSWCGDLEQLPRAAQDWRRVDGRKGKIGADYRCAAYPGVAILHCGHPTALRPYYFAGLRTRRKVQRLADAKAAVEAVMNGLIGEANL